MTTPKPTSGVAPGASDRPDARDVPPSAWVLVTANLVPLLGVLLLGWSVFAIMLLYWCENVIVGAFNVLKMLFAQPRSLGTNAGKLFIIPFFIVHYGMFTLVHGVFVIALFGPKGNGFSPSPAAFALALRQAGIGLGVLAVALSHGFSFLTNYLGSGEYRRASLQLLMAQPYARVVVLHIAILGGGFLTQALGAPLAALLVLVVLKTGIDYTAHLAERRKLGLVAAT
jgi:Family of unknown function (DUF6498)